MRQFGRSTWLELQGEAQGMIRPDRRVDILGDLLLRFARCPDADFARFDRQGLSEAVPKLGLADYLLFCSHPILEDETEACRA